MGPLTHASTTRAVGAPLAAGLWLDLPVVAAKLARGPRARAFCYWLAEQTHGAPGAALAALLGPRWLAGWGLHVALDTISHTDGGATGKTFKVWAP